MYRERLWARPNWCVFAVALFLGVVRAQAGTVVSQGAGNWYDGGTWDSGVPGAADDVYIRSGDTVTITGLSAIAVSSLSVTGVLKHADNSSMPAQHKIILNISGDCTIETGGEIDVEGLGYDYNQGPGKPVTGGWVGGSHGGRGGHYQSGDVAGATYGSVIAPTNLGSGGSATAGDAMGGGAVQLNVGGACTIDGTIDADGSVGTWMSGAGGSVYITTGTFGGVGTISVKGGPSHATYGSGGGGRIAVVLTNGSTFGSVTLTAAPSTGGSAGYPSAGTIFTKTSAQSYGTIKVDGAGLTQYLGTTDYRNQVTELPSGQTVQVDSVCVTNMGNLWVPSGATLIVTDFAPSHTSGYLTVEGTLDAPDDFTVSNLTFMPHAGCTLELTNLTISSSARVTHFDNRASEDFTLEIDIPGNLSIESGASIDVTGMGYRYNRYPGGWMVTADYGVGASHGGRGGYGPPVYGSDPSYATYGSITAPTNVGSGGHGWANPKETDGGGVIKITVGGTTTVGGSILADGTDADEELNGGGAGGSIWLTTSNLAGVGTIRAEGGSASFESGGHKSGGGGGGRVAVILTGSDSFASVSIGASGGTGTSEDGAAGTVYKQSQTQGAGKGTLIIDNTGASPVGARTDINSSVSGASVGDVIIRNNAHLDLYDNQSITVNGSWSNAASFTAGAGAVVEFAGTDTVSVIGSTTFDTLICTNVSKQITFEAGMTQDVDNVFTFTGPSDTSLVLRSTSPGTQWLLDLDAGAVVSVEHVDVEDSDARPGMTVVTLDSADTGNNSNWVFAVSGLTNVWIGPSSATWGDVANWSLGYAPIPQDAMVVISNGTYDPSLPSAKTFNNLEVQAGAILSLAGFDLTVNGQTVIAGTLAASGSETITVVSNLTLSGSLAAAGTESVYVGGNLDFTGGTFTQATSHVYLNGTAEQSVTSDGERFYNLTVTNQSALVTFTDTAQATFYYSRSGNVTYGGNFTGTQFHVYSEGGAVTQTFNAGSTYVFEELWLHGSVGKTQHLESAGTWNLNVAAMAYVLHADVAYSDASGGIAIVPFASADSGNNVNWVFGGPHAVWTGAGGSSFHTAGSWEPAGVPDETTYILVDDATTLTVSSPATVMSAQIGGDNTALMEINSAFTVVSNVVVSDNGTLEINNDPGMTVTNDLYVAPGGALTHQDNSTTEADTMMLTVMGDLTIAAGGKIDVEGLGYDRNNGPGKPVSGSWPGASHGGRGGHYLSGDVAGATYGSVIAPTNLGSGGGPSSGVNTSGGGAVRLVVGGACTIDGTIDADGTGDTWSGGAGGSVYITAGTFGGSGTVSVDGGWANPSTGGGAGGRIAVALTSGSTFGSVTLSAAPPSSGGDYGFPSAGTIFTKIPSQTYGTIKVDGAGLTQYLGTTDYRNQVTELPPGITLQVDSVCVTNMGNLWVPSGATLIVTDFAASHTSGYLTVEGTLDAPDDFTVSNLTFMPHAGCTLELTNLTISSSARVTHFDNRASEDFTLEIDIPGNLSIESGASIDVTGMGYRYNRYPGGWMVTADYGVGASHGGRGGNGPPVYGSDPSYATYGSITAPTNVGSGGHGWANPKETDGGGVIKITVGGTTTVGGSILADGTDTDEELNGGGAGGSIWLTTSSLAGVGTIRAEGGSASFESGGHKSGGGGGGRVAVILTGSDSFASVSMEASGGTGTSDGGAAGTVYKQTQSEGSGGGTVIVDNNGVDSGQTCMLPAEDLVATNEVVDATVIVTNTNTKLTLTTNVYVGDILVYTSADLVLGSYTMYVSSAEHHIDDMSKRGPGGPTNTVVDSYDQIVWLGVPNRGTLFILR